MSHTRLCILIMYSFSSQICFAQQGKIPFKNTRFYALSIKQDLRQYFRSGDSIGFLLRGICKGREIQAINPIHIIAEDIASGEPGEPMVEVHGNILYDFSYRSYIDTPFAQTNLMQHLVQTNLNFLIKGKYPVALTITNRSNNSRYFRDFTDVNVQFSCRQLLNNIKSGLSSRAADMVDQKPLLNAQNFLAALQLEMQLLGDWLTGPARTQEMAEEKERIYKDTYNVSPLADHDNNLKGNSAVPDVAINAATNHFDSAFQQSNIPGKKQAGLMPGKKYDAIKKALNPNHKFNNYSKQLLSEGAKGKINDSDIPAIKDSAYIEKYNKQKQHFEKLRDEVKKAEEKVRLLTRHVQDSKNKIYTEINNLRSTDGLYAFMDSNNISRNELTKAQRLLLSINKVGIGRSWVDYSELTVKNISVSGVNMELNPNRFYFAFAAGKVNYRFRDFIYAGNEKLPDQRLYVIRAGVGQIERNNIIATFYNGNKSLLNYTQGQSNAAIQKVMGVSLEAKLIVNSNNYFIAEVAKSSFGANTVVNPVLNRLANKVFDFNNRTNEAYSVKLFSQNPSTDTRLTAYYKKTGENFQSFNLYPVNINQDAWMVKLNQQLWKRKLMLDAAIRKNDFVSPFANQSFSSQAVFKSLQVTLRIPKYPFVSIGYYPSSQLTINNNSVLSENHYNTFNTIVNHSYNANHIAMNSNAVFTKFYNNSSDTGFIYYNATAIVLNHSIFLLPFTLQTSIGSTNQKRLSLFTLEEQLSYQVNNFFSVNAGLKYNRLNRKESLFGGTAAMSLTLKNIGTFQLNYDKTYLPSDNTRLLPVDIGRMSFYKEF